MEKTKGQLFEDTEISRRFSRGQWRMLGLTIVGYTLFYFMRKNFSFAMPGLEQDLGVSKSMLGSCLAAGGIVYGLSKFVNGMVGDKVNPRKFFCFGLAMCVLVNMVLGFVGALSMDVTSLSIVIGGLYVLNQFFQGTGFPPCAKLIAFWVPPKELATKMSVWNTSHSIGGGLVAKICGVIMGLGVVGTANQGVGMWKWCFWSMAIAGFLGLVAMWLWLPGTPEDEGLPPCPGTEGMENVKCKMENGGRGSGLKAVFASPAIWLLGLCNFCINASRALVADWGPTMLQETKGLTSSESGTAIMCFEFAGIVGMLAAGWATDRLAGGRGPRVCVFMMALAALALVGFWLLPSGLACGASLALFGFMLYGPQALTGVAATNLCGKQVAGTSIGFISLFSYIGVAVAGKACGSLVQSTGSWLAPVSAIVVTLGVGAFFFCCLWRAKANNYS